MRKNSTMRSEQNNQKMKSQHKETQTELIEENDQRNYPLCIICLENEVTQILVPCRHSYVCQTCIGTIKDQSREKFKNHFLENSREYLFNIGLINP